ncbi:MAG: hypothetical protein OSB76_00165 [Alphaproteobacteria bacterium]|nr:hypothetical protein [Alphaproteobacteria bacterium]
MIETSIPAATVASQSLEMPSMADRVEANAFEFCDRLVAILDDASGFRR